MKTARNTLLATLVAACSLLAGAVQAAVGARVAEEAMTQGGLHKVSIKGFDLAYVRSGSTLAAYNRFKLDPVEVAFDPRWDPKRAGNLFKLGTEQREAIRSGVATIVLDEFSRELQASGGYPLVAATGPDVLRLKINIVDLYVDAPDTMSAGPSRTYARSSGNMTVVAELIDSESGQVLARLADRRESVGTGSMRQVGSVINASEAAYIAAGWARMLRRHVDEARASGIR